MPLVQDLIRPYARLATSNRLLLYGVFSITSVSLVIFNAFINYSNFYSVAVYLSRSNRSVLVLANFGLLCSLLIYRGFQQIFFGSLRAAEVERLYDKIWFFLTESLLAFTIFRDEFDVSFGIMFGFLLFVKCFHWLTSFRVEWMDQVQYPGPNVWFHIRMNILFFSLWVVDMVMLGFAVESILTHGMGGIVLFASEYAILIASLLNSVAKYLIIFYDIRRAGLHGGENAPVWEDKSMFIFYVELATDFLKLITYLAFFVVVLIFYGLPLNILRDIYITARSFIQRCRDLVRYRTATRNMDERYPNATEAELSQMNDRTCIICREEMVARDPAAQRPATEGAQAGVNDAPKKLPCGHVFHFHCLRSWLERQQSCPTCRRTVLEGREGQRNAPGQDPGAAPPQPGAVPQQGFGDAQQERQGGRILRWLAGAMGAPPIVPGQFAPGPDGFNQPPQQQPLNQGFPAQNPFGPWQQPGFFVPQQQHQQLPPPVQVLQGFYIGNQWQPWGEQAQQQQPQLVQPPQAAPAPVVRPPTPVQQTPAPAPPPSATTDAPTVPPPAPSQSSNEPSSSGSSSGTDSSSTSGSPSAENAPTPRQAAALAALRRYGALNTQAARSAPTTSSPVPPSSTVPPQTQPRVATNELQTHTHATQPENGRPNGTAPSLIPLTPTPTIPDQPPAGPSTSTVPPPNSSTQNPLPGRPQPPRGSSVPGVPSLIPLFDPATTQATIVPPPSINIRPSPYQRPSRPYVNFGGDRQLPDLRSLPQTLTQEQLERLDTLTREAIDERLRVLENMQGVMWRCAEELIRIRSVLPLRPTPTSTPQAGPSTSQQNAEAGSSTQVTATPLAPQDPATDAATAASSSAQPVDNQDPVVPAAVAVPEPAEANPNPVPQITPIDP